MKFAINMSKNSKRTELEFLIGSRLKYYRIKNGMSQTLLGDNLGLTFQQIQKYEKGENRIPASTLYIISKLFQISTEEFFSELDCTAKN
jgi:transcriptional regulator with XRE-family HTH domain